MTTKEVIDHLFWKALDDQEALVKGDTISSPRYGNWTVYMHGSFVSSISVELPNGELVWLHPFLEDNEMEAYRSHILNRYAESATQAREAQNSMYERALHRFYESVSAMEWRRTIEKEEVR